VYTPWLNPRGGVEADVTVARLSEQAFLVVTPAATLRRDMTWLARNTPAGARAVAVDVTSGEAVLGLMGPRARDILARLTPQDVSAEAMPFGSVREIELAMALVRVHRVSYVGEFGAELFIPTEFAVHVFDALMEAGADYGLRPAGMHAMDSCRLEKAFRHFGHDMTDEDHVLEAGLGFAVAMDKPVGPFGEFIGRQAVAERRASGLSRRLLTFRLHDPQALVYHGEPIWCDGTMVGHVTSAAYGHTIGSAIALGYVAIPIREPIAATLAKNWQIEIAGKLQSATASVRGFYDPEGLRLRS
jgi:4-methylaminobutanoate oxidase (formaldehyde-forming)